MSPKPDLRPPDVLDPMPVGVSEGLASPCVDCGDHPRFDYLVADDFWRKWVPDMPARISVVCLTCLDKRCDGVGLGEALGRVDWTGTRHTVSLQPLGRYFHDKVPEARRDVLNVERLREAARNVQYFITPGNVEEARPRADDIERVIAEYARLSRAADPADPSLEEGSA